MRQAINVMGSLFSMALALVGGAFLLSIPGIGFLIGGVILGMSALMVCGVVLARILELVGRGFLSLSSMGLHEMKEAMPTAA